MPDVAPERLERRGFDLLWSRDPRGAEQQFRALLEQVPDSASGWAGLVGALRAQGRPADAEALAALDAARSPGAAGAIERLAGRRLSGRGLVFDRDERFPLVPMSEALEEVATAEALRSGDNVVLFLDRGGEPVDRHPVLELDGAGGPDAPVRFRTGPKFVASIRNAAVIRQGLVLTEDGAFIEEAHPPCSPSKYGARVEGRALVFEQNAAREHRLPVKVFDTPAFLMAGPTSQAFGDWIVNFVPRLALADAAGLDCPILLRSPPQAQAVPILEALGVGRERLVFHDPGQISVFPKLYAPCWPSRNKGAPMAGVFDVYRRAVLPPGPDRPLIYLTRQGLAARPLLNEAEVCRLFAGRGFKIVNPGELSLDEVRRLFASPACVAGPFGSAFHNLVFSGGHPPGLVLIPPHVPFSLTEIALWQSDYGNRFAYVVGDMPPEPHDGYTPWTVPLEKVERALDRLLELVGSGEMPGAARAQAPAGR